MNLPRPVPGNGLVGSDLVVFAAIDLEAIRRLVAVERTLIMIAEQVRVPSGGRTQLRAVFEERDV